MKNFYLSVEFMTFEDLCRLLLMLHKRSEKNAPKRAAFHVHEDSQLLLCRSESSGQDNRGSRAGNRRKHLRRQRVSELGGF